MARIGTAERDGPDRSRWSGPIDDPVRLRLVGPDRKCVLRCYPQDDAQFEADAHRVMTSVRKPSQSWEQLLEGVRSRMKLIYPAVTIRPRHPIAAGEDKDELWYCFRDGGVFPP